MKKNPDPNSPRIIIANNYKKKFSRYGMMAGALGGFVLATSNQIETQGMSPVMCGVLATAGVSAYVGFWGMSAGLITERIIN